MLGTAHRVVALAHARQRTTGEIGVLERDGAIVALCAHRCDLAALPPLDHLTRLERLDVGANRLVELPALPPSVRELYIHDNQLVRLPPLPPLRVLDANRNRLTELPPLAGTEFVYAAANRLTALPALSGVRYLNACENPLADVALDDPALEELRLEQVGLRALPPSIARLSNLRELALRGNALTALPDLAAMTRLEVLDLRANQLAEIPATVCSLPALAKLDLRWNPLHEVPPWLVTLAARVYL